MEDQCLQNKISAKSRGIYKLNVNIPKVICIDCKRNMMRIEGTSRRICYFCDKEIEIEVIEK